MFLIFQKIEKKIEIVKQQNTPKLLQSQAI